MRIIFEPARPLLRTRFARVRSILAVVPQATKKSRHRSAAVKFLRAILLVITVMSFAVAVVLFIPDVYYRIFSEERPVNAQAIQGQPQHSEEATPSAVVQEPVLPPQDMTLPDGEWVVIPRIGVRTQLRPTEKPEDALDKGVWQVPDYGMPGENTLPIILAAHRFGWQWWWKTDYWKYNSFYHLPETELGDRIEIIADHRKWVYEIYEAQEGEEITDYDADLILYTCKFLNSPIRYFRYAKLIEV
jgi:sortase (surface protein transpeptidase)